MQGCEPAEGWGPAGERSCLSVLLSVTRKCARVQWWFGGEVPANVALNPSSHSLQHATRICQLPRQTQRSKRVRVRSSHWTACFLNLLQYFLVFVLLYFTTHFLVFRIIISVFVYHKQETANSGIRLSYPFSLVSLPRTPPAPRLNHGEVGQGTALTVLDHSSLEAKTQATVQTRRQPHSLNQWSPTFLWPHPT